MSTNPMRTLPAVVLLVVLALLPIEAWRRIGDDRLVVRDGAGGLDEVRWTATVAPDGRLAARVDYDIPPRPESVVLSVRLPPGARSLAVDGLARPVTFGLYADVEVDGPTSVTFEVPGRVERFADGTIVRFATVDAGELALDEVLVPCPICNVDGVEYGQVELHGALVTDDPGPGEVRLAGVDALRAEHDGGSVRFVARNHGEDVWMVALLGPGAALELPLRDGTARAAFDELVDAAAAGDGPDFREPGGRSTRRVVTAIVLTGMFALLAAWVARQLAVARAQRREEPGALSDSTASGAAPFSRPSDLEPALAGLVVGARGPGDRSIVAGTLLELARRGVITIDGVDSRRFVLTVPAGASGATPFEEAVLDALRPQGQRSASATLTGPPLWGPDGPAVARRLGRTLFHEGKRAGLVRQTLSALVLLPAAVAMGVVALVGSGGLSWLGWASLVAGPPLAIVTAVLTGLSLTRRGYAERRRWEAYADWLRANSNLDEVGAPGIATWGEVLPHAAALGAAPVAAEALSPRSGT